METIERQHEAAGLAVSLISSQLGGDQGVHPETAISTAARLAGSMLFRSFQIDLEALEPGSVVLSEEANERGPLLIRVLGSVLEKLAVPLDESKLGDDKGEEPILSFSDTLNTFQNQVISILETTRLDYEDGAIALAMATAFIVKECSPNIGAEVGFNAAVYGFIEGTKTAPP